MARYRKKPVVIEAVTWYGKYSDETEWPNWFRDGIRTGQLALETAGLAIITLEGTMIASVGDKIIRGVKGEIYPCKPDIFDATYDEVG